MTAIPTTVLIGNGMLAHAWREQLDAEGKAYLHLAKPGFDLTDPGAAKASIPEKVECVINCAAYTAVDDCETHEQDAMEVNATGVGHLAERCHDIDALLVHYSTDYVFNGQALEPYEVGHAIDPVNAYGRTKAAGDRAVRESGCLYRIIRTSWLYAPWGNNFVRTMAKLTAEKDQLKVVDDQRGRPTSAQHLVKTSQALIEHGESGTYHATDGGACTWYEFTKEIARQLGHTCDIQPCTTADFPRPAKRPAYSVLDLSKTEAMTGALPDWKDNLKEVLDRMTG